MVEPIKISLDFYKRNTIIVNVKQLDDLLRIIEISCTSNGKKIILDNITTSAFVRYKKPSGVYVLDKLEITSTGTIDLPLKQSMLSEVGRCIADVMLVDSSDINIENIEDIINSETLDGVGIISTMSFYINVEATAIDHSTLADIYKKDELIDIIEYLSATDNYIKGQEKLRNEAEISRETTEGIRETSENKRIQEEQSRVEAEIKRQDNVTGEAYRIENERVRISEEINRDIAEKGRIEAEIKRQDNVTGEAYRIGNEQTRITNEQKRIEDFNQIQTDYNQKVENLVLSEDIANNLNTEEEGKVLDATQGKVLNDNIIVLKNNLSNPNLLINGDFQVWQRGTSFTNQLSSSGAYNGNGLYCSDRWYFIHAYDAHPLMTLAIDKIENGIKIVSNFEAVLKQKMETPLKEENYIVSAKINGEIQTLQITGGTYIENDCLIYEMDEYETIGVKIKASTTTIEWVKLEQGSIATSFVSKTYAEELLMCQRYYYVLPYAQYVGAIASGVNMYIHSDWVRNHMRDSKTIINSLTEGIMVCYDGGGKAVTVSSITWNYESLEFILSESVTNNRAVYVYFINNSNYIAVDAELY